MKNRFLQYLKHLLLTLAVLLPALILFGLSQGATLNYGTHEHFMNWHEDGPYAFYENDSSLVVNYILGNQEDGFMVKRDTYATSNLPEVSCHYQYDSSSFTVPLANNFSTHKAVYDDGQPIIAISDIEGNYRAFRDFLIRNEVIDQGLNWIFGKGHLVLVGDFVDRGAYVTQVLWLIRRLEHDARSNGGRVHYIIGNHELKAMHGNTGSASEKYLHLAAMLNRQQYELMASNSYIGRWLESKNALELINGHLFVHGGLHPDLAETDQDIEKINNVIRANYRQAYFPRAGTDEHRLLLSGRTGPCWYRGYFKADLYQSDVLACLEKFGAKDVIVGHTLHGRVTTSFSGKVIAIDVKHPSDHEKDWPRGTSEGLLIDGENYYRLKENGSRKLLNK